MSKPNKLLTVVNRIHQLPTVLQSPALTYAFNSKIKYAGTTGIYIQEWSPDRAIVTLDNKRHVQNHIQGIHATAMATLAESTTGMVFGLHVPDDKLPLLKRMSLKFVARAEGDLKAVATLPVELQQQIRTQERGSVIVPVQVTDATGKEPIQCEMEWAWTTKNKKVDAKVQLSKL
jgi:acyl-coenzyme A thioesterase PaaI-like protein